MEAELSGDEVHLERFGHAQAGQGLGGTRRRACSGDSHLGVPCRRGQARTDRGRLDKAGEGPHLRLGGSAGGVGKHLTDALN